MPGAARRTSSDPKDDVYPATPAAAGAGAAFLVGEGRNLLDLDAHGDVAIIDADTFLRFLEEDEPGTR